jgi:ATP-binding cassette subfamily C protein
VSNKDVNRVGVLELRRALLPATGSLVSIGLFSVFVNLLMLVGPLFMLQVYDRVLGSRSEETLVTLFVLVTGLYILMGVLDYARGRVMTRVGASLQLALGSRVFAGSLTNLGSDLSSPLHDLESVQKLCASPAIFALLDIPWIPVFITAIFVFHPMLGWLALGGGALLIVITIVSQSVTLLPVNAANQKAAASNVMANSFRAQREVLQGLGMKSTVQARWLVSRNAALDAQVTTSDLNGIFGSLTKTLRMFLQSAILALGAYLVLRSEVTPGVIIACSIMLGRALAPVEQTIAYWPLILRARYGWHRLASFLDGLPVNNEHSKFPRPRAILEVRGLTVVPPGGSVPTLRMDGFDLAPGQALGVVGKSASGKSSLARVLTGIWQPISGSVRLDGTNIKQYKDDLGLHIGYLPQEVILFDATVAENIARLSENPNASAVIEAAKKAGAHEMIQKLSEGYDTVVCGESGGLSSGQKQRIGLARALFGNPVLLILDEPNANLDLPGSEALNRAIEGFKKSGGAVIIMAHRPSGIAECDLLMIMQNGMRGAFGPRDEVLRTSVKNHEEITGDFNLKVTP